MFLYDTWARRIASSDLVGREVFRAAPGYPYFLGIVYALFGRDLFLALMVQSFLGTLSCLLIFLIARRHFGLVPAYLAAFLAAAYQMFIFYDAMLVGSSLSVFLDCLGLYVLTVALEKPQRGRFVLSGFVLGAAALTSPSIIVFILIAAVWLAWRKQAAWSLILLVTVILTIAPVTLRNYLVAGDFVPITAHGGLNFYIGNNPSATGVYQPPELMISSSEGLTKDSRTFAEKATGRDLKPSEVSRFWFNKGLSFILAHPARYAGLVIRKAGLFINATEITDLSTVDITRSFCPLLRLPLFRFGWLFPLAVIGIVVSWPLLKGQRLLFFFFSGQMISCCLYFVNARYRLPAAVAVCVFAGYAVFWLTENIIKRRFRPVSLAVAAGLAAGVIIHLPLYRPSNTIAIYNLALVCQRQGRVKEAERLFQDVVRMSPNFDDGYYALGYLYWTQGRRDDAVAAYKKALALNPDFAEVRYNLGFIYSEEGKLDEAQNQFERALSIKPDYKEVLQSLEALCPRRNDSGRARNCWRKVLEFDPDNEAAQQHLKSSGPPQ